MTGRSLWIRGVLHDKSTRVLCRPPNRLRLRFHGTTDDRLPQKPWMRAVSTVLNPHASMERSKTLPQQQLPVDRNNESVLNSELTRATAILNDSKIPSEKEVVQALEICQRLARSVTKKVTGSPVEGSRTPVKNLLSLDDRQTRQQAFLPPASKDWRKSWLSEIEGASLSIITHKNTFITPGILKLFVQIAVTLRQLQNLPGVFDLYASKSIPIQGTSPISYAQPDPTSMKAAVPLDIAQSALNAAIEARDLPLCLNITSTSVATTAFRRSKVIRKVSAPALMVALTPMAAYQLALRYTESAVRSDADYAFDHSFLAFLTLFSMTSVMGFYAIVQSAEMDRVTWQPGTKLHSKWTREEERQFADRIAQAWGFQEPLRRGEEEGKDWKNLRQWLMNRSMDLDRADLMEGME